MLGLDKISNFFNSEDSEREAYYAYFNIANDLPELNALFQKVEAKEDEIVIVEKPILIDDFPWFYSKNQTLDKLKKRSHYYELKNPSIIRGHQVLFLKESYKNFRKITQFHFYKDQLIFIHKKVDRINTQQVQIADLHQYILQKYPSLSVNELELRKILIKDFNNRTFILESSDLDLNMIYWNAPNDIYLQLKVLASVYTHKAEPLKHKILRRFFKQL